LSNWMFRKKLPEQQRLEGLDFRLGCDRKY